MNDDSPLTTTTTSNQNGHLTLTDLLPFESYPDIIRQEMLQTFPAVQRYNGLLRRETTTPEDNLRIRRHRAWLACAAATYSQKFTTKEICRFWSEQMDSFIAKAWNLAGLDGLPVGLFALGKLGAQELNLSSDIDVVIVRADSFDLPKAPLQQFQKILCDNTPFGFCTRIDLDLRPGGRLGPIVSTIGQFTDYYGNHGETWERLAFTRFRPIIGDITLFAELRDFIGKFSYRRHLDYTLFEDLKILRGRIHQHYQQNDQEIFNLKLHEGGIRDIELFIHALLVIHGGRRPELRTAVTDEAIHRLKNQKLLPEDDANFLMQFYWHLRYLENYLQMIEDQQTHSLDYGRHRNILGSKFPQTLQQETAKANSIVSTLMGSARTITNPLPETSEQQQEWLHRLNFTEDSIINVWPKLRSATALSRRTEIDERERQLFLFNFVTALSRTSLDRDLGLSILTDFVKATRAKATFFTLLNSHPAIIENLSWLFSTSPYLGTLLVSRPELIDGFILHSQLAPNTDTHLLLQQLADRRLLNELHSASNFLANRNILMLTGALSDNADSICIDLAQHINQEMPTGHLNILCLGKWGGSELGLKSDLDFIFLSTGSQAEKDIRAAKRFTSLITTKNKGGSLYSIDLRLRPSGSAGPLLVTYDRLHNYLTTEAAAWERQAYLRARPLFGEMPSNFYDFVDRGLDEDDIAQIKSIRLELWKKTKGNIDIKYAPGGLIDLEFSTQVAILTNKIKPQGSSTLAHLDTLAKTLSPWRKVKDQLVESYLWLRTLEQCHQLLSATAGTKLASEPESFRRLSRLYGTSEPHLHSQITDNLGQCRDILKSLDPVFS